MKNLQPNEIIDLFIGDCTLPSTKNKMTATQLYEIFEAYCEQLQIGAPCSVVHFGRCLGKRFQRTMRAGRSFYFCEIKPSIIEENSDGAV